MDKPASRPLSSVPDTLDLAEHGRLAVNGLLGTTNPDCGYENYFWTFFDVHPAYMVHVSSQVSGVLPEYVEAVPLLRLMSGSREHGDPEAGLLASVLANAADDGLMYDRATPDRPWNTAILYGVKGWNEDYANLAGNGWFVLAQDYYYQATGDEIWKARARRTAERMLELAVVDGDYAYYPNVGLGNDFSYPRVSGWVHTREPGSEVEGAEGSMKFYQLTPVRGFLRWYARSGDERFLDISRRMVNFNLKPKWWGGLNDIEPRAGAERGHFFGHYYGHLAALHGLLDYAIYADDWRLKQFVRDSYEWSRHHGIPRLGAFPSRDGDTEGCTVAEMLALAIKMTDAGIGDYWDDADHYVRNGLVAVQATDAAEMERVSQAGRERPKDSPWGSSSDMRFVGQGGVLPRQETTDRVIARSTGAFGHLDGANFLSPRLMHCCTANGSQALYYAWEGVVRQNSQGADVNLWLNRRSPWVDVWSWLPYEGKLVVQNKGMGRLTIRVPGWVPRGALRCWVNSAEVQPEWVGNRIVFAGLAGDEELRLETPIVTETTEYTLANLQHRARFGADHYICEFRGNTAVHVEKPGVHPGGKELIWYRVFRRDRFATAQAPLKALPSYVHPANILRW